MRKPEGRIKRKMRVLLASLGYSIDFFWQQEGDYRKDRWDLARWGAYTVETEGGSKMEFHSWDRMTDCVRDGFTVSQRKPWEYEIHRNEKKNGAVAREKLTA